MNWILLGLLAVNLLLLVWLLMRPAPSPDAALAQLGRDLRDELQRSASGTRQELSQSLGQAIVQVQQTLLNQQGDATRTQNEQLDSFRVQLATMQQGLSDALRDSSHQASLQSAGLRDAQAQALARFNEAQESALKRLSDGMAEQLRTLSEANDRRLTEVRLTVEQRLQSLQADNEKKLEQMRQTVDEKLHATLEQRLGESFKLVSDRLEQVHKGLGEMQTLAGSVGDLKRVMTNVKSRGTWGEMQLGAIIDNVLTPDQFGRNVKTVPDSDEMVEYAIRLPGKSHETPVWLPIDAKYPVEQYQRLLDAQEAADKPAIASAGNAFEASIRLEAKKICAKYVSPPHTTDFAVLYLPSEGLFAEVMRRPGLVEAVQNDCRVMITGPANLAAMLNSLQMGFKTLAIEKRSSEVWALLGTVKTEFSKFGEVVEATKKSIDAAAKRFEQVDVRTRAIQRRLRDVQDLPAPEAQGVAVQGSGALALPDTDEDF